MEHVIFTSTAPEKLPAKLSSQRGQGGLIAIAVSMLIAFVIAGAALTGISQMNAKRSVVTKQTLQTYYAAQAGIQEALATRMLPRSNLYSYVPTPGTGFNGQPYYTRSGLVYRDPVNQTGLIGVYRYMILGGDAARKANGTYYAAGDLHPNSGIPRLLATDSIPPDSPFIIVSNALTCKNTGGAVAVDQITMGLIPTCNAGFTADELTLVARARLMQEAPIGAPVKDRVNQLRVFKNSNAIQIPSAALVPGEGGWRGANSTMNFNNSWLLSAGATNTNSAPQIPKLIVFYNFVDNTIHRIVPIAGTVTNVGNIPANSVIRLYFNGPIDYRSISPTYDRQLSDCKTTPSSCNIRIRNTTTGTFYGGNSIIPLFPGSTEVILLPPLTNTIAGGGTPYELLVDTGDLKSFHGNGGSGTYSIRFNSI